MMKSNVCCMLMPQSPAEMSYTTACRFHSCSDSPPQDPAKTSTSPKRSLLRSAARILSLHRWTRSTSPSSPRLRIHASMLRQRFVPMLVGDEQGNADADVVLRRYLLEQCSGCLQNLGTQSPHARGSKFPTSLESAPPPMHRLIAV